MPVEPRSSFTLGIGEKLTGFGLEDGDERAERHVIAVFDLLVRCEQSLTATTGEVLHASFQFRVGFQGQEPPSRLRRQTFAEGPDEPVESPSRTYRFQTEIIQLFMES